MAIFVKRKRHRGRTCLHCKEPFSPDPRNLRHHAYCSKPECRAASKRASQRSWLSSCKGHGYFKGPENSARVRLWRAANPKYWKRTRPAVPTALQDVIPLEPVKKQDVKTSLATIALQDICLLQPALLIGLIANLSGSVLQDDIVQTARRLLVSGRDILGNSSRTLMS